MEKSTILNLEKSFFSSKKKVLIKHFGISVNTFLYPSGVEALEVTNSKGKFILLPYQGQQIWKAGFLDREITMGSMFKEPVKTKEFLNNYGGFLVHCGASAMGVPQEEDKHPQHGELPNAAYNSAYIKTGVDGRGKYAIFGGYYKHMTAFTINYLANPEIKIYEDSTVFDISMKIKNQRRQDMDLMYLMHVNFKPVDGSTLYYSAKKDKSSVRVGVKG